MNDNQALISKDIRYHWLWISEKEFSRFQAWVDLIASASEDDEEVLMYCHPVSSRKKGEAVTTTKNLMKNWGWSRGRVVRFLKLLEDTGAIKKTAQGKMIVIEILEAGEGLVI